MHWPSRRTSEFIGHETPSLGVLKPSVDRPPVLFSQLIGIRICIVGPLGYACGMPPPAPDVVSAHLADIHAQWSMGTCGAIAEFMRDADENAVIRPSRNGGTMVTARGGFALAAPSDLVPVAYETLARLSGWNHAVALCLPALQCAMAGREALTELGPDREALRDEDRNSILFDLGLGALQVDVCVRTQDAALLDVLRKEVGRPLFDPGNPAVAPMLMASPHRVFLTRLGRAEVYQPIPRGDGKSPDGPHTHLLPKLLMAKRTHAATNPIPEGLVPCAHVYPPHPAKDALGRAIPFDGERHRHFQVLLRHFGDPSLVALKARVAQAVEREHDPSTVSPGTRLERTAVRIALRQVSAEGRRSAVLGRWLEAHDSAAPNDIDEAEGGNEHG